MGRFNGYIFENLHDILCGDEYPQNTLNLYGLHRPMTFYKL